MWSQVGFGPEVGEIHYFCENREELRWCLRAEWKREKKILLPFLEYNFDAGVYYNGLLCYQQPKPQRNLHPFDSGVGV